MANKQQLLSRTTYRRIKNMDREQLSGYVTNVYIKGYEAGRKAATPDLLLRTVRETLLSIDGIGPTRADAIMKKMSDTFALKEKEAEPTEGDGTPAEISGNTEEVGKNESTDEPQHPDTQH